MNANILNHPVYKRIKAPGPKRILALDGGGIRGALSLGFLEEIERILRDRQPKNKQDDFRLCQYFDLIGGTSTGSIIAACLALGMSVADIKEKYLALGKIIFKTKRKKWVPGWFGNTMRYLLSADYSEAALEAELKNTFVSGITTDQLLTIGSDELKTGLCILTKRADTYSTWPVVNNPSAKYYDQNCDIPLWEIVRSSAAAPTYFRPHKMHVGNGQHGVFVDGGVSSANNPSLMLFMVATLSGFRFNWASGSDQLMVVSVGTGYKIQKDEDLCKIVNRPGVLWGKSGIDMFMADADYLNQMILQYLSNSPTPATIDREVGDLSNDTICDAMHYVRYNTPLEQKFLSQLGKNFSYSKKALIELGKMDNGENAQVLYEIGKRTACGVEDQKGNLLLDPMVKKGHFISTFDI